MWLGTSQGLSSFAGGRWRTYRDTDGLPPGAINCLLGAGADASLWAGTTAGFVRIVDGRVVASRLPSVLRDQIVGLAEDNRVRSGWRPRLASCRWPSILCDAACCMRAISANSRRLTGCAALKPRGANARWSRVQTDASGSRRHEGSRSSIRLACRRACRQSPGSTQSWSMASRSTCSAPSRFAFPPIAIASRSSSSGSASRFRIRCGFATGSTAAIATGARRPPPPKRSTRISRQARIVSA